MKPIFIIILLLSTRILSSGVSNGITGEISSEIASEIPNEIDNPGFVATHPSKKEIMKLKSKVKKITDKLSPSDHDAAYEYFTNYQTTVSRRNLFNQIDAKDLLDQISSWGDEHTGVLGVMNNYALIERIAEIELDHNALEQVKKKAKLRHYEPNEEIALKRTFWKKIASFIQTQESVDQGTTGKKYFNVIKFLTQRQNPNLTLGQEKINDFSWGRLRIDMITLSVNSGLDDKDLMGINLTIDKDPMNLIDAWFFQLMRCKQTMKIDEFGREKGSIPEGVKYIRNRTKTIVNYLSDLESRGKTSTVKELIQNNILENAKDCPDAALTGLEAFELGIKLSKAGSDIQEAFGAIVQDYKKEMIESIVDHGPESREEYLYLLLLFNQPLSLGLTFTQMQHRAFGARKTFDQALDLIFQNLVYENMIFALSEKKAWQDVMTNFIPVCAQAKKIRDSELEDIENLTKNENIYKETLKINTKDIFDRLFTSPSQYLNFSPEKIIAMKKILE